MISRRVFATSAGILLVAGLIPKFSALLRTIPQCVLGGAVVSVFASIAMTGIRLLVTEKLTARNATGSRTFYCDRKGCFIKRRMSGSNDAEYPQRFEPEYES